MQATFKFGHLTARARLSAHTPRLSRIRAELAREFSPAIRQGIRFMDQFKSVPATEPAKSIVETAIAAGKFTNFVAGVKAAGLIEALSGKGPFTVFAPTDEAFRESVCWAYDALLKDTEKLKSVLKYHVISGRFMAEDIKTGETMTSQGSTLSASVSPDVRVNGARVTQANIVATNGVIHAIDTVLVPKHLQLLAAAA
jgi:uncharacterized surface protein with fasciclin (FAS1) repeats